MIPPPVPPDEPRRLQALLRLGLLDPLRDALEDLRFADNPLVTGEPHVRFCPPPRGSP